jgi:broad specificity phosphatase PhoE
MAQPVLYYIRHGLTDWNAAGRLQGQRDIPLNATGRVQAVHSGEILADLFARDRRGADSFDYVSSPLVRASETMDAVRKTLGLEAAGYRLDARLSELSFGTWEGLSYDDVLARDPDVVARREHGKWDFQPPGGESYVQLAERVGAWYETVERDTVVTAHGGTGRALVALTGVAPPETAAHHSIEQGVVYVFADRLVTCYT